ncbi:MAG: hypothetical protein J7L42_00195 [Elusimicrobia bacterium]|nr:hypothetical protein [Elusimicrobiota bacterium]
MRNFRNLMFNLAGAVVGALIYNIKHIDFRRLFAISRFYGKRATIFLNDGGVIEGTIEAVKKDYVIVRRGGKAVFLYRDVIRNMEVV